MSASDPTATEKVEPSTLPSDHVSTSLSSTKSPLPPSTEKPIILHLGDDIRWNQDLYAELGRRFEIKRSYSVGREEFKEALREKRWGDFVGMYRPFWNTGGEMGNWDLELISLLPSTCKIFASAGAGFDWVDTHTMATHGITYCNAAPSCTESVADTALFLLLSTFRAFTWSFLAARSCSADKFWDANRNIAAVTHNPNGHTLGIVGLGKIGYRIAQKVRVLEMEVCYHDIVRFEEREKEVGVKWCETLDELLAASDAVVLATPFSGSVLLSREKFTKFKPGARLINIARGKLIDEDALVEALDEGRIGAAGLDVHADEPNVNPRIAKRENVMVLSHTAGASVESHVGFERLGMENLLSWLDGKGAITPVNLKWLKEG